MPERLSVLHVAQPTEGGVSRSVPLLVRDQVARGWRVAVVCPTEGELAGIVSAAGASHLPWAASRSPGPTVPGEMRRLHQIVESFSPDLVHLHSSKAGLAGRLALRGRLPTVFHPRGWSFLAVDGPVRAAAVRWERLATRWTDRIVCVSEAEQRVGEQAGVRGRFLVVPNAIDPSEFPESSDDHRQEARRRLGLPEGPLAVCVARLSRAKGVDVLLDAWPSVVARVPQAQLVVVGSGPDEQDLLSRHVANARLAGHREDVSDWLAAADVVAVPSRWEGMSIGMLEAMARGRSVVSTDVPGAREAIGDEAGAVVSAGDPPALADAIAERLLDPVRAAAEGRAGRRAVEQRHDYRRRSEEIAELYAEIIERRAR